MSADMDAPWPLPPSEISSQDAAIAMTLPLAHAARRRLVLAGPEPLVESLHWHDVAAGDMPDAEATVLLWTDDPEQPWAAGWLDSTDPVVWRLCESGGVCAAKVTHWSQPGGPSA